MQRYNYYNTVKPVSQMQIKGENTAGDIASSPAEVESLESYQERIGYYKTHDFTYIPIPSSGKYYDTSEGWKRDLRPGQHIKSDESLDIVFARLLEEPFLLVSSQGSNKAVIEDEKLVGYFSTDETGDRWLEYDSSNSSPGSPPEPSSFDETKIHNIHTLESERPKIAQQVYSDQYSKRYGIITLADLNKRSTKDALYPLVAELAYLLSLQIEDEYPDSEKIIKHLRAGTVGRWYKSKKQGIHMHIAEQINLVEMQQVIAGSDSRFVEQCGFSSKNQVQKKLGSINELRNKVMHANRSLVHDRDDLQKMLERLDMLGEVVTDLRESVDHELTN